MGRGPSSWKEGGGAGGRGEWAMGWVAGFLAWFLLADTPAMLQAVQRGCGRPSSRRTWAAVMASGRSCSRAGSGVQGVGTRV